MESEACWKHLPQGISTSFYPEPIFSLPTLKNTQAKHKFPTPTYELIQINWKVIAGTSSQCVSIQMLFICGMTLDQGFHVPSVALSQWSCSSNPRNFPVRGELPTFPLWRAGLHSCTSLHFLHSVALMSPPVWWKAKRDSKEKHNNKKEKNLRGEKI